MRNSILITSTTKKIIDKMASTRIINAIDEALVLFDTFKTQARSYKFDSGKPCIINFENPMDRDFYQDDVTESASEPYSSQDRSEDVANVLAECGFSDSYECSPCFEMAVRQYCFDERRGKEPIPVLHLENVAEAVRTASNQGSSRIGCRKNLPKDDALLARDALSSRNVSLLYGFYYSCCLGKVCDPSKTWHCRICKQCQSWRSWHCKTCNKCQFGLSIPCKKCQPDLYMARMSQCADKHLP